MFLPEWIRKHACEAFDNVIGLPILKYGTAFQTDCTKNSHSNSLDREGKIRHPKMNSCASATAKSASHGRASSENPIFSERHGRTNGHDLLVRWFWVTKRACVPLKGIECDSWDGTMWRLDKPDLVSEERRSTTCVLSGFFKVPTSVTWSNWSIKAKIQISLKYLNVNDANLLNQWGRSV